MAKCLTIHLEADQDTENPAEMDCQWRPYSFSQKHINFREPDAFGFGPRRADGSIPIRNPGLRRKMEVGLAFILSYFEHGNSIWSLNTDPARPRCQWDSVSVAGVLVWEDKPEDIGSKTYEDRAKDAKRFLETYTAWCNGECYYYRIEDEDGEDLASCGGFIGPDLKYMFDEIRDEVKKHPDVEVRFVGDADYLAKHNWKEAVTS